MIFLLISFQAVAQEETVEWNSNQRLSWSDFKGNFPENARAAATTASGISYRFSTSGTKDKIEIDFTVLTHFYPNKSWYQVDLCDDVILSHEQLHFDISELFSRKLRKQLAEARFTHDNVKAKVRAMYRKNNQELNEFQNQYDRESNFSRNREQQVLWNIKIAEALESK